MKILTKSSRILFFCGLLFLRLDGGKSKKQHNLILEELQAQRREKKLFKTIEAGISFSSVDNNIPEEERTSEFGHNVYECVELLKGITLIDTTIQKSYGLHQRNPSDFQKKTIQQTNVIMSMIAAQDATTEFFFDLFLKSGFESYQECLNILQDISFETLHGVTYSRIFNDLAEGLLTKNSWEHVSEIATNLQTYFTTCLSNNKITQKELDVFKIICHDNLIYTLIMVMNRHKIANKKINQLRNALICAYAPQYFMNYVRLVRAFDSFDKAEIIAELQKGVLLNWIVSHAGYTPFHCIFLKKNFDLNLFKILLYCPRINLNLMNKGNETPLTLAVEKNNYKGVRLLLKEVEYNYQNGNLEEVLAVDINHKNSKGETALIKAVQNNDVKMVKLLLQCNANKNIRTANGLPLYNLAKNLGNDALMNLLI